MRAGPNHPIIDIRPNQVAEMQKTFGFKTPRDMEVAIDILITWAKKQNHFTVREFGRDYLESFIINAKGSIEKAKHRLDKRCTLRNLMPEIFTNIQVRTEFNTLFTYYLSCSMPICTKDFYRVLVNKFVYSNENENIDDFNLLDIARYFHVKCEYSLLNEYVYGYEFILDLQDIALTDILAKQNPMLLRKILIMLQEAYGCRVKKIHLIYDSKVIDTIVAILKQGLSEKLGKRIQVHNSHETLHNFIDKECLPSDYGGTGPSIQEGHDRIYKELCTDEHIARMKEAEQYATDETKRLCGKFNEEYLGMPGSFRTLSVD